MYNFILHNLPILVAERGPLGEKPDGRPLEDGKILIQLTKCLYNCLLFVFRPLTEFFFTLLDQELFLEY